MTETEVLERVKEGLNIYGNHLDNLINTHIREVKNHMIDAGVPKAYFNYDVSVGMLVEGVRGLYFNGVLSTYFRERMYQLKYWREEDVQA